MKKTPARTITGSGKTAPVAAIPAAAAIQYGYARVSTDGQSVEAQVRQLTEAGCTKVFREVASGALGDRTQLRRRLTQLKAGNMVLVTRLDRLARSTRDLLNTPATITDRGAGFRSLGDNPASEICRTLSAEIF